MPSSLVALQVMTLHRLSWLPCISTAEARRGTGRCTMHPSALGAACISPPSMHVERVLASSARRDPRRDKLSVDLWRPIDSCEAARLVRRLVTPSAIGGGAAEGSIGGMPEGTNVTGLSRALASSASRAGLPRPDAGDPPCRAVDAGKPLSSPRETGGLSPVLRSCILAAAIDASCDATSIFFLTSPRTRSWPCAVQE